MSRCACGKYRFWSRKSAKKAAGRMSDQDHDGRLHAYRCDVDPSCFHLGHMPGVIKRGEVSRSEYISKPRETSE